MQIARQVQQMAKAGKLPPGTQLPTVRRLAGQLGLNFNTVARAYRLLHGAGVVSTQRGRGTYISARASAPMVRRSRQETVEWFADQFIRQARQSGLSEAEMAETVRRRLRLGKVGK